MKTYVVGTCWNCLSEVIVVSNNIINFLGEVRKTIFRDLFLVALSELALALALEWLSSPTCSAPFVKLQG